MLPESGTNGISIIGAVDSTTVASSVISPVSHANTIAGDLLAVIFYTVNGFDPHNAFDSGAGWMIKSGRLVTTYSGFLALKVAERDGTNTYSGINIGAGVTCNFSCVTFRLQNRNFRFCPEKLTYTTGVALSTSNTNAPYPALNAFPYAQCVDIVAGGYNSGAAATTASLSGNFTEAADYSTTSPPGGVFMYLATDEITGPIAKSSGNVTLSANRVNKVGFRVAVPIESHVVPQTRRYLNGRRIC